MSAIPLALTVESLLRVPTVAAEGPVELVKEIALLEAKHLVVALDNSLVALSLVAKATRPRMEALSLLAPATLGLQEVDKGSLETATFLPVTTAEARLAATTRAVVMELQATAVVSLLGKVLLHQATDPQKMEVGMERLGTTTGCPLM